MQQDPDTPDPSDPIERISRWAPVALAALAACGAVARIVNPAVLKDRLDQTTLLYLIVAGVLLLLRHVKTFSFGQLKVEMIEKIRERQDRQQQKIDDMALVLPLLLPEKELKHIKNLASGKTDNYEGSHALRTELRRLRSIGLISKKPNRNVADLKDKTRYDLSEYIELTDLGRRWAARVEEMETPDKAQQIGQEKATEATPET